MRPPRLAPFLAAVLLAAPGCSGSDDDDGSGGTTTASGTTSDGGSTGSTTGSGTTGVTGTTGSTSDGSTGDGSTGGGSTGSGSGTGGVGVSCVPDLGLQIVDLTEGTGAEAMSGDQLTVHYTGWLCENGVRGTKFDSSVDNGNPFSFTVGVGQVIEGWDMGIPGMKVGGMRELVIPPELAYGSMGAGGGLIPPDATLDFEVELLSVP